MMQPAPGPWNKIGGAPTIYDPAAVQHAVPVQQQPPPFSTPPIQQATVPVAPSPFQQPAGGPFANPVVQPTLQAPLAPAMAMPMAQPQLTGVPTRGTTVVNTGMGQQKSAGAAYALWLFGFLGFPGFHRIYLNETAGGVTQLVLGILGWIGLVVIVGLLCLIPVYIWWFIDLFLIPGLANRALGGAVVIVR